MRTEDILGWVCLIAGFLVNDHFIGLGLFSMAAGFFIGSIFNQYKSKKDKKCGKQ